MILNLRKILLILSLLLFFSTNALTDKNSKVNLKCYDTKYTNRTVVIRIIISFEDKTIKMSFDDGEIILYKITELNEEFITGEVPSTPRGWYGVRLSRYAGLESVRFYRNAEDLNLNLDIGNDKIRCFRQQF